MRYYVRIEPHPQFTPPPVDSSQWSAVNYRSAFLQAKRRERALLHKYQYLRYARV